jgi:hypothetical protein
MWASTGIAFSFSSLQSACGQKRISLANIRVSASVEKFAMHGFWAAHYRFTLIP